MCTNPGKRLCSVFGRISSIQLKTATTVQIVREIGARMITPCKNNLSSLRGALRIEDMCSLLGAKITYLGTAHPVYYQIIKKTAMIYLSNPKSPFFHTFQL